MHFPWLSENHDVYHHGGTAYPMAAGNNEFVILGKTLNLEVESPTVKSFKLKHVKDLFSFTVEIRCKKAKKV